jgi:hypothetical protein
METFTAGLVLTLGAALAAVLGVALAGAAVMGAAALLSAAGLAVPALGFGQGVAVAVALWLAGVLLSGART